MRRTERYTVPLPDPWYPDVSFYRLRYRELPWWYRLYLRLRAFLSGIQLTDATRRHYLQEIRRRLEREARTIVDCSVPALIQGFFSLLGPVQRELGRLMPAVEEATGTTRGRFLVGLLHARNPNLEAHFEVAGTIPDPLLEDPTVSLEECRATVRDRLAAALSENGDELDRAVTPVWNALQTLRVLARIDLASLQPVSASGQPRTPLRVVAPVIGRLYQCVELAERTASVDATDHAIRYFRTRGRLHGVGAGGIWNALADLRHAVPLLDLARFAAAEPFLALPQLSIRGDWRAPLERTLIESAVGRVGPTVVEARARRVRRLLSEAFLIDREPAGWLPEPLYPRTTAILMVMAGAESFRATRRALTQLVIDGRFNHLDTRNALHQAALQLDQALERTTTLFGDDARQGTLSEEIARQSRRAGSSSLVRRQLMGLYERYRPRVRGLIEEICASLLDGGQLVSRTINGSEEAFELDRRAAQAETGGLPLREQLQLIADQWARLSRELTGLYQAEAEVTVQRIPLASEGNSIVSGQ